MYYEVKQKFSRRNTYCLSHTKYMYCTVLYRFPVCVPGSPPRLLLRVLFPPDASTKIVLPMLLLPIKIVLLLATPINALRIHPFAVPSCAPQSARAALVVMRWDPKKDPIEDPVPVEVRDGRVPEYKPPAPEYQPPEDGCEIVCYHPRRCLRFRCDRLAPLL